MSCDRLTLVGEKRLRELVAENADLRTQLAAAVRWLDASTATDMFLDKFSAEAREDFRRLVREGKA